jgi:DNA-binding CsgD family transcriptional regulator
MRSNGWKRACPGGTGSGHRGRTWALLELGPVYLARGGQGRAAAAFVESLGHCYGAGDRARMARSLEGLVAVATRDGAGIAHGEAGEAARLLAAAEVLREVTGSPIAPSEQPAHERAMAAVRACLGEEAFAAAWTAGRDLPLDQVVERGRTLGGQIAAGAECPEDGTLPPSLSAGSADALTPREREIAALIGRAYTNRQIAEQLVVTERTVEVHARNIRERLGLETRAQMVAWAIQHGLAGASE